MIRFPARLKNELENLSDISGKYYHTRHCVKSVCIQNFPGPHFPAFEPNTARYEVPLYIQPECEKIWT